MPQHPFDNGELKVRDELLAPFPRTGAEVRRHIAEYYAMISEVDFQIGRVLDALDASPHAANTFIVFAGDNGLAVGQHGLLGKQNLYDHSLRVPLIVAGPGIPKGKRDSSLCHLMDIAPTVCDLAGAPLPEVTGGQNLLKGKPRPCTFAAYRGVQRALRTKDWKLVLYNVNGARTTQLFDLKNDPDELRNLAGSPAHRSRLDEMKAELHRQLAEAGDPSNWTAG
jgi:arylsulfatase A-like enzyme